MTKVSSDPKTKSDSHSDSGNHKKNQLWLRVLFNITYDITHKRAHSRYSLVDCFLSLLVKLVLSMLSISWLKGAQVNIEKPVRDPLHGQRSWCYLPCHWSLAIMNDPLNRQQQYRFNYANSRSSGKKMMRFIVCESTESALPYSLK